MPRLGSAVVETLGVHHVAFAVEDLDAAITTYERHYAARLELRDHLESQAVDGAFLMVGTDRIELVAATADNSAVGRFLASRGPGMHHVAIEVVDVATALASLQASGAELIDDVPRLGLGGHSVAFVHPNSQHGVLMEVVGHD